MSEYVPVELRRLIRERAGRRCGYCLVHEDDSFWPHEPWYRFASRDGLQMNLEAGWHAQKLLAEAQRGNN